VPKIGSTVLTLLILEFGLGVESVGYKYVVCSSVLTLLILEFGLGDRSYPHFKTPARPVLILLVLEFGLGVSMALEINLINAAS